MKNLSGIEVIYMNHLKCHCGFESIVGYDCMSGLFSVCVLTFMGGGLPVGESYQISARFVISEGNSDFKQNKGPIP